MGSEISINRRHQLLRQQVFREWNRLLSLVLMRSAGDQLQRVEHVPGQTTQEYIARVLLAKGWPGISFTLPEPAGMPAPPEFGELIKMLRGRHERIGYPVGDPRLIIPPGYAVASYTSRVTTTALMFAFQWEEVPI